ncbi:MAG TPA: glycoside hydrolase family 2 TIM barrel-domain containing protein [Planctomycetota bacterium]|jgi:hypothetical protein
MVALSVSLYAVDWQPQAAPLMTRWAKDVSPEKALPEYPRPQMVRKDWLNLNGLWEYAITDKTADAPKDYAGRILVPFPIESALSGVMKRVSEKERLWYHRNVEIPQAWAGKRVLLHFGAVDWETTVFVNGKELGKHRGGYDGFSFDITDAIKPGAPQEIVVGVFDPTDAGPQPRGKQVRRPGGIFYTPVTGIWQTVWLEPVAQVYIDKIKITPDVDGKCVRIVAAVNGKVEKVSAAVMGGRNLQWDGTGKSGEEIVIPMNEAMLWSPENPILYDLIVDCGDDHVQCYFGMRKIAMAKDERGVNRLMLNGKFVFQVGTLDQGFWPDGIYTAPTDEALRFDIEAHKKLGYNMLRKHVKVEPERWYYWCDKLGLLVWQDMPSGSAGNDKTDTRKSEDGAQIFEQELKALIEGRYNHPSIIMWVVFNEGWGQYDTPRLTKWTKDADPSRLVNNASGWTDRKCGDVIDMHNYPGPGAPKLEADRASVLGEFGGLGLGVDGHTWTQKTWGYQGMASSQALTKRFVGLMRKVYELKDSAGLNASIYTQITDVETECNGLYTYDRALLKLDEAQAAAANKGEFPPPPETRVVLPTAQNEAVTWRYTIDKPADDWFSAAFDASAWKEGVAGFGTNGTPGAVVRTEWKTADIWARREFMLDESKLKDPQLMMHHDEDAEVYINGKLAAKVKGFISEYEPVEMNADGKAALKPGKNIIAVHCHQTTGGQYIDVGIFDIK